MKLGKNIKNLCWFIGFVFITLFAEYIDKPVLKMLVSKMLDEQVGFTTISLITLFALLPASIFSLLQYEKVNQIFKNIFDVLEIPYIAYIAITFTKNLCDHKFEELIPSTSLLQPFLLLVMAFFVQKMMYSKYPELKCVSIGSVWIFFSFFIVPLISKYYFSI